MPKSQKYHQNFEIYNKKLGILLLGYLKQMYNLSQTFKKKKKICKCYITYSSNLYNISDARYLSIHYMKQRINVGTALLVPSYQCAHIYIPNEINELFYLYNT